jgi:hypothetical protein
MLPAFMARWLRRSWAVIEALTLGPAPPSSAPQVPPRTVRRWRARLSAAAWLLVQLLLSALAAVGAATQALGSDVTRHAWVVALAQDVGAPAGRRLAVAAALLHQLHPGVRLM